MYVMVNFWTMVSPKVDSTIEQQSLIELPKEVHRSRKWSLRVVEKLGLR